MEMPEWLKKQPQKHHEIPSSASYRQGKRFFSHGRFIDKTLCHAISFMQDALMNETISQKRGLIQSVEPRLKVITVLFLVVILSLQKSLGGIMLFTAVSAFLVLASRIPLLFFIKKLLPAALITFCIALPSLLNIIIDGEPLFVLHRFESPIEIGPVTIPEVITITEQGSKSAAALLLRVITSVSLVFLMTMTTKPAVLLRSVSSLIPGYAGSVVSMSYRYIFLLTSKVELFIMGLKSRQIADPRLRTGRHWVASRISLLFSLSMKLSSDLSLALESRGYRGREMRGYLGLPHAQRQKQTHACFTAKDVAWLVFTIILAGVMFWKSLK